MKRLLQSAALALVLCLSGCQYYGGIAVHPEHLDEPEFYAPNPIGILGGEYQMGRFKSFCEHQSSIPYFEQGFGLNECGVKMLFNY